MNVSIIDFGNTRVKIKIHEEIFTITYLHDWQLEFKKIIKTNQIKYIYYSSVNSNMLQIAIKTTQEENILFKNVATLLNTQKFIDFSDVIGMGDDRKFGIIAAVDFARVPLVTIDCGTAITINLLNDSNKVLGGMIMPGAITQAKSLEHFTNKLPLIRPQVGDFAFGKNTDDAINTGINAAIIGGIKYIISKIQKDVFINKKIHVIFTGGYGELVMQASKLHNSQYIKNLVLLGMEKIILKNI